MTPKVAVDAAAAGVQIAAVWIHLFRRASTSPVVERSA